VLLILIAATPASAQVAPSAGGGQAVAPVPVPLSGRTTPGGTATATQAPVPGATTSVDTLNPTVLVTGAFGGSTREGTRAALTGPLSLQEALRRGLEYNLGQLNLNAVVAQARGLRAVARSALMPVVQANVTGTRETLNLAALGFHFESPIPGFSFPSVVGPFNLIDIRASGSLSVFDLTAWNNYRASNEALKSAEFSAEDAHNLVVLAVGGTYLQAIAARGRVAAGRAQLETANALFQQTSQRRGVGLVAQVDVGRSEVQALTQQQRLTSLQSDFAKQKINLARMVGLPPTDQYELAEDIMFAAAPMMTLDEAIRRAIETRPDLKAAAAQLRVAERGRAAARAERLPSFALNADYGTLGPTLPEARSTFTVVGRLRVPIWLGGRTEGEIQQAEAAVRQRRAELDDLNGQIEADVRKAYLDVEAASNQVTVSVRNQDVAQQTLNLTRQRFDAGITDNVEVVQAQEAAAEASLDYVNSVFAHNLAKLSLARAIGIAADRLQDFLKLP
jgi:outer membrane protein TolC